MQLTDKQLNGHLKQTLLPVYLVCGDIPLLMQESCDLIRKTAQQAGYEQRELIFIESHSDWPKAQNALENLSLFSEKSFIEIRHPKSKWDEIGIAILSRFLEQLPTDKRLLIVTDKLTPAQQKSAWCQMIDKKGVIVSLKAIPFRDLPGWITQRLKQNNLHADAESIQSLAELTEGNLLATQQAVEKLRLLYPNTNIDKKAVASVMTDNAQFNIFDLTNYLLMSLPAKAIHVLNGLRFAATEATLILWAIARELRLLYGFAIEKKQGVPLPQVLSGQWPSRQPMLQKILSRLSDEKIAVLLQHAEKIDHVIKGITVGNAWQLLEKLCLDFCHE